MRKIVLVLSLVALAVLFGLNLTSAQESTPLPNDGAMAGVDQDLTGITIKMATIGNAPYELAYTYIPMFEQMTGAHVEIVFKGDGFQIDKKLTEDFAASAADYDVIWDHTSFFSAYVPYIEPLNSYFSADELSHYTPRILDAATVDGNLYMIPRHADISVVHYRTDLYNDPANQAAFKEKYGYDLAAPTTWKELGDQAMFFSNPSANFWGTQWAGKEEGLTGRFYELLVANGGNLFDSDLKPIFNNDVGLATAQWLHDLYQAGAVPPDMTNYLWPEVATNFCNGQIAVYTEWYGWYSYFQDPNNCPNLAGKFGLVRAPEGTGGVHSGWAGAHGYSIVNTSENKQAAAQLIKFLTSEFVLTEESRQGALPVRDDVWTRIKADAASATNQLDRDRLDLAETQLNEDFFTPPLIADWINASNIIFPAVQEIMITKDIDIQARLDQAAADVEQMMSDAGYYNQ
jgi:multiple sugar transport system substrate-binding protein